MMIVLFIAGLLLIGIAVGASFYYIGFDHGHQAGWKNAKTHERFLREDEKRTQSGS